MRHIELPEVGRIVEVTHGRDKGLYMVVVGHVPDRFVLLADGHVRKVAQPKKKNLLHVRVTQHRVNNTEPQSSQTVQKFTNAQLRYVLRELRDAQFNEPNEEVDGINGEG